MQFEGADILSRAFRNQNYVALGFQPAFSLPPGFRPARRGRAVRLDFRQSGLT